MDSVGCGKDSNVKFDIKAPEEDFAKFIDAVKSVPRLSQTAHTPADDKNHFVVYKFSEGGEKCVIAYDTKACKISLTAKADVLERFKSLYIKRDSLFREAAQNREANVANNKPSAAETKNKQNVKQPKKAASPQNKPPAKQIKPENNAPATAQKQAETASAEYKNGYAIKKYERKRLDEALKAIKAMRGVAYKTDKTANKGKPDEAETYIVTGKENQKVILRYMPKKQVLQMQGKRSYLFSEVQVRILKDVDFKSAVGSHIELAEAEKETPSTKTNNAGNTQSALLRRLKKILPNAFDYLGEQSKIELAIGYVDINNNGTRLSDYSSLLTPPCRALEKFISDLQRARGIEVKMIGQGYEKDDGGNYRLKSGYRRRIDSVVYNEVMSALYTEYFSCRNFYLHSDNTDGDVPRVITDKAEVKRIFDNLIAIIDYNSKKLKEIGFSLNK